MGALIQVTLTEKNNKTYSRTRLLSTWRVGKFWEVIDASTLSGVATRFHYQQRRDRRVSPSRYKTPITKSAFWQLVREATNETHINVQVDREYKHGEYRVVDEVYRFAVDDIVEAWDDPENSGYSYMIVEDVHFRIKKYRTTHTIDEIDAAASVSQSNSPS
jgi:hypothetical protein